MLNKFYILFFVVIKTNMEITADNKLRKLIIVGDRVLVLPDKLNDKTKTGLYLPQGLHERELVQTGTIVKTGPGYPLPANDIDETWKPAEDKVKYLPLQAAEGDKAIYLNKGAIEVVYDDIKYVIVPQQSILMLVRDEEL